MANPVGRPANKQKAEVSEDKAILDALPKIKAPKEEPQEPESKIQFFGEVDMDDHGNITSEMPAWYFDVHIEKYEQEIERKERWIKLGYLEQDQIQRTKEEIKQEKKRLKEIKDSIPKLSDGTKDRCWRAYESLAKQIKETMPTRKEALDGLVSPHHELKRLKSKHIKIDPEIAKACGVNVVKGKVTGDEANKCYQILGKAIGDGLNTNVEALRRDGNTEAYKSMNDLTQSILKGIEIRGA